MPSVSTFRAQRAVYTLIDWLMDHPEVTPIRFSRGALLDMLRALESEIEELEVAER